MKNPRLTPLLVTAFIVSAEIAISFNSTLLPNIKAQFVISDQLAQLTIAGALFALGFSGMVYGGLADSLGRRPMLLFSVTLFSLTALLSASANNVTFFLIARFFQGIGSGAGWVVGNACLKDLYHGKQYTKMMNYIHAIAGITPAVAPVVGSYLAVWAGWRNCFYLLFVISALAALSIYFFQPETLQEKKEFKLNQMLFDYRSLFKNRKFIKYLQLKVLMVMLILCEVSTLPLVLVDYLHIQPQHYGFYILPAFFFYVSANLVGGWLSHRQEIDKTLKLGLLLIIVSNMALLAAEYLFQLSPVAIMAIKCFTYAGWGFIFGNATAEIVSAVPGRAGMASAVMIALEMLMSSIGIYALGFFFNGTFKPLSLFMILVALLSGICLYFGNKEECPPTPEI